MRRFGLHLNSLRAFEAAARLSSFSRAADELSVSHSTISHHVKGLETALGVALFERRNRSVVLTKPGEILFPVLEKSFDNILVALDLLRQSGDKAGLKVTATPSFANKWLVPRLRHFRELHPATEVELQTSLNLANFEKDRLDIGVRTGTGEWPGLQSELLMPIHMTPVCSPDLHSGGSPVIDPGGLHKFTLIHADVSPGTGIESEWAEWLTAAGATYAGSAKGLNFHDPGLALQAAIDGLGIAMGYLELAAVDIAAGRLVQPFRQVVRHPWSYYIVRPAGQATHRDAEIFREWLRTEAARF